MGFLMDWAWVLLILILLAGCALLYQATKDQDEIEEEFAKEGFKDWISRDE